MRAREREREPVPLACRRPAHLQQLAKILEDPEASENDRFVALELLKNANVAAAMVLPGCQDTGTGIARGTRVSIIAERENESAHWRDAHLALRG